jgi:cytochrome P450
MREREMTGDLYWDPYNVDIFANPYPNFDRLREEAPVWYNEQYNFYAVSRFEDAEQCLMNRGAYSSKYGSVLEFINAKAQFPAPIFIFHDPPVHTAYRGLVSRIFTPARMNALDDQIRAYCANALDPVVGAGKFDFVKDLGAKMPIRVIGMLIGIPEQDIEDVQKRIDDRRRTEPGRPAQFSGDDSFYVEGFGDYVDWRIKNPGDDLMTTLLNAEFVDENGVARKLTRDEVVVFCNMFAGAGNDTTNRLISWTGKVLGDHPDQRREIHANRALIQPAVEELLRFENPGGVAVARYVLQDVEMHGVKIPEGSTLVCLTGSGNRDPRRFENGNTFNIHRPRLSHLTFGVGFHACVGNALARVEARIALDEILKRFRDWEVDHANARMVVSSTTRGYDTLPTFIT